MMILSTLISFSSVFFSKYDIFYFQKVTYLKSDVAFPLTVVTYVCGYTHMYILLERYMCSMRHSWSVTVFFAKY